MRKNRRNPKDPHNSDVWDHPERYTRAVRRSVGYREPVSNSYTEGYKFGYMEGAREVLRQIEAMPKAEPTDG